MTTASAGIRSSNQAEKALPTKATRTVRMIPAWFTLRALWSTVDAAIRFFLLLDRGLDQRPPLGPGAVVVADVGVAEDLGQNEPGVSGALPDPAVGDRLPVAGDALRAIELLQLGDVLEGAVLLDRLGPGDVLGGRDVAAPLGAFLGQVLGGQELARVLARGPDVDQACLADPLRDIVAVGPDRLVGAAAELEAGGCRGGDVGGELAALGLQLDAAAVDELDVVEPVGLQRPVGVGGEPVVVVAIEDDGGLRADAALAQQLLELLLLGDVTRRLGLEVVPPVPAHGAGQVALLIGGGVDVD